MKTKPRGIWANFRTTCTCGGELTITNGRIDPHDCRPWTQTIHATDEEVTGWQEIRRGILKRLEEQMNSPDCPVSK